MSKAAHKEMTKERFEPLRWLNSDHSSASCYHEVACWVTVVDGARMDAPLHVKHSKALFSAH